MSSHVNPDPAGTVPVDYADCLHSQGDKAVLSGDEVIVVGHAEAMTVAADDTTYSSSVSRYLQLPNGLDGEEHARFRALVDRYLREDVVADFEPAFRSVAADLVEQRVASGQRVDAVGDLGVPFAVRAMMVWLGWPPHLESRLIDWVAENNAATRSGEHHRTAAVAKAFDEIVGEALAATAASDRTVTAQLMADQSLGRPLDFEEIVSILRNWTGGDLSSMAYCIGVVLEGLSHAPDWQDRLRKDISRTEFVAIVDEFLRIDNPFVSNRRITTCPVTLGAQHLPAGQKVRIHWTAANRDPDVFSDPDRFAPEINAGHTLTWGHGRHMCPGKDLSMLEMRAFFGELLKRVEVRPSEDGRAVREIYPTGGWRTVDIQLTARTGGADY